MKKRKSPHELVGFLAAWAVKYAEDYELDGLHPTHYDLMEKYGARMNDFKRASNARPAEERGMDPEQKLELIALLAQDKAWDAVVLVGRALLDHYYPADIFTGSSGDSGPQYAVALREALARIDRS